MKNTREHWIDHVKVFACILVTLGHFFQSMTMAGILDSGEIYQWFNRTIYYFHVPLFFICSGYVYQKYSKVRSFVEWRRNALKKVLVLGIPYFVFSMITWAMKTIFAGNVNSEVHNLGYDLFVHPMSPYWYLFAIFFIFLLTGTFTEKKECWVIFAVAAVLKLLSEAVGCYAVKIVIGNQIWFVIGMVACQLGFAERAKSFKSCALAAAVIFLILSIWEFKYLSVLMGLLACFAVMILFSNACNRPSTLNEYTMPVFLMHTIFAAGVRAVLLKLGVDAPTIHIVLGLGASFAGPIVAAEIMKKMKLDILYQPGKYIKINI